jgi:hypothetical protein
MSHHTEPEVLASELAASIVGARVGAASGRPNATEGRDAADYYRVILAEVRRGLGLPAREGDGGGE